MRILHRRCGRKKVIVSTGSKALQDRLYNAGLPTIARALAFSGKTALLKGRSSYLCLERLEQQNQTGGDLQRAGARRSD
ncbi:hypothetical protein ACE0DR_29095 [Azotobacter sp. CWF10]